MDSLAKRLDLLLAGEPPAALATRAGVTRQTLYNILAGTTRPEKLRAWTLFDLARELNCSAEWLLYGRGERRPQSHPAGIDPATLEEAWRLLLFDEAASGVYTEQERLHRLAALYNLVAADGGSRLSLARTADFMQGVAERGGRHGNATQQPAEPH